jgi:tetratricopeptide (TPR) repeat protein
MFAVAFYRGVEKVAAATKLLEMFIETSDHREQRAHCYLTLGQIATDEQRFETALNHFGSGLALKPADKKITYVLHNNIGYCLNMLGRHPEGERHCRLAIEINSTRASAYRNLGISLEAQGNLFGAAWAWVEATKVDTSDLRALTSLKKLLSEQPALLIRCPWILDQLKERGTTAEKGFGA